MPARVSANSKSTPAIAKAPRKPRAAKSAPKTAKSRNAKRAADEDEDAEDAASSYAEESADDAEDKALDSDALDEDDDVKPKARKRKRGAASSASVSPKKATPAKKRRTKKAAADDEDEFDLELEEGQEVVGRVVKAPKTGRVPAGQISRNTLDFLELLKKPECNDREWFKLHEPVYRVAENEWKSFVEEFTTLLVEVDPQIPPLPPKDLIHRIYRDVRFSNDKTPYKTGFSASISRSGRKGIFAGYHISVRPGDQSLIAAGTWCPGKNELATIRSHILRSPARLRAAISAPAFVRLFGAPTPGSAGAGARQNIFGMDDELKTAPKGIDKGHKDIDLLKCRSFAVVHRFADAEVLAPGFKEDLARVARIMQPFVHLLNEMMTLPPDDDDDDDDEEADENDNRDNDAEDAEHVGESGEFDGQSD